MTDVLDPEMLNLIRDALDAEHALRKALLERRPLEEVSPLYDEMRRVQIVLAEEIMQRYKDSVN